MQNNNNNMKKLLLFSLVFILSSFIFKAYCQEELQEEDTQTTLTKAQQKKLAKEASKQKNSKTSTTKNSKTSKTTTKVDDNINQDEYAADAPPADGAKNAKTGAATGKNSKTTAKKKDVSKSKKQPDPEPVVEEKPVEPPPAPKVESGDRTYTPVNKSSNPPTYEVMDSTTQGNLNLYRPLNDTNWVTARNLRQAHEYKTGVDPYPAKPRNMWEIGLNIGFPTISGDVQQWFRFGKTFGYGLTVRKALGYVVSLRAQYNAGTCYGLGWKGVQVGVAKNLGINGYYDPAVNYQPYASSGGTAYLNYKMSYKSMYGQLIINLNNIKFHKERPKVIFYAIIGGGPLMYHTMIDQLDKNGKMYDYSKISNSIDHNNDANRRSELKSLWDGTYESYAEQDVSSLHLGSSVLNGKAYTWRVDFTACLGMGMSLRLNRRWNINFETMQTFTADDLLDGQRWDEYGGTTISNDNLNYTSVSLNYHLGSKSSEPLWWLNPMDNQLVILNETKNKLARIPEFTDSDNDGVIDFLDREPNTPEGCPVDTHGVMLDSDKDGVPDCRDKEPFSAPGAKVDVEGVAEKKNNPEMDSLMVHIKDLLAGGNKNATFPGWYLPMIHFDLDKDYIKPDFYPDLFHVAQVMKIYPQMKLYVDGHTDIRHSNKYNEELSHRRAENARNFLLKNYGIDPVRLIVRYLGKTTNLVKDLPDHYDSRFEREQYINRRVEFTVVPESMQ